jgi:FkbM family methyltransferase
MIFEGAVVIDIGANIGAHTLRFAHYVGTTGMVVAVEPTGYAFERLKEQVCLNPVLTPRIILLQAMLMGSQDATLAEQIESSWPLHTPKNAHPEHAGVPKATTGATVRTLDGVVSDLDLKSVDFLKLDVDGYEVEVLRGARKTLQLFSPVIFFEHAPYGIAEKGYNPHELTKILTGAGYAFTSLKKRDLVDGNDRLPEIKSGAGINLIALPRTK